jgi:hypothetical protein
MVQGRLHRQRLIRISAIDLGALNEVSYGGCGFCSCGSYPSVTPSLNERPDGAHNVIGEIVRMPDVTACRLSYRVGELSPQIHDCLLDAVVRLRRPEQSCLKRVTHFAGLSGCGRSKNWESLFLLPAAQQTSCGTAEVERALR